METGRLSYKDSQIAWYRFGSGPLPVLCFHGYGETAQSFAFLERHAGDQCHFLAIDLPFHGQTDWREKEAFTRADLLSILEQLIPGPANEKWLLMGYSLGGRIALSLCEILPTRVSKLVLLAPDGLKVNFWYWLATQTWLGNQFFAFTMKRPGWFFGFLKLLNKLGLVNTSIYKFVNYYIGDPQVRTLLYQRWTQLRKFRPHTKRLKALIREQGINVNLVYGQHDRIILASVGEKFRRGIEDHCRLSVINAGHQVLHEKHIAELLPALLH